MAPNHRTRLARSRWLCILGSLQIFASRILLVQRTDASQSSLQARSRPVLTQISKQGHPEIVHQVAGGGGCEHMSITWKMHVNRPVPAMSGALGASMLASCNLSCSPHTTGMIGLTGARMFC